MDEGVADDGKTEARQIDPSTPAIASPGTSGPQQPSGQSLALFYQYSTIPRNENRVNKNHLEICLSFSQKNENSLTWI